MFLNTPDYKKILPSTFGETSLLHWVPTLFSNSVGEVRLAKLRNELCMVLGLFRISKKLKL